MRRRRTQQVVVAIVVVGFVLATFGLVVAPGDDAAPSPATLPSTIPRALDPAACDADIEQMTGALGKSFEIASSDAAPSEGPLAPSPTSTVAAAPISDAQWTAFFEGIARHCEDVGEAVSEVIMFSTDRVDTASDSVSALAPALTAAQLCNLELAFSADAQLACASADELLNLDDLVDSTTADSAG